MTRLTPDFWAAPFAHRGLHDPECPENSLAALSAALEGGFGIEIDIQPSSDGEAMVFHDYDLDRLTGAGGPTAARSAAELAELKLKGSGEGVPTLPQALALIAGRAPLLIEIKDQSGSFMATDGALERRVCEAVEASGHAASCAIMSFNPFSANHVRKALPEVARGIVSYDFSDLEPSLRNSPHISDLAGLRWFKEVGGDFVSFGARSFPSNRVAQLREQGVPIFCWTIRSPEEAEAALEHCDQITFEHFIPDFRR